MPLTITVPARDFYDDISGKFISTRATELTLEHSLLSISKWESKWHKPFYSREEKTADENLDYIRCMCLTKNVDDNVFLAINGTNAKKIADYIADPMSATTINNRDKRPSKEIITSELIYFWMTSFSIPFDPCEKWHINRLMTLIEIASIKNSPSKKMSPRAIAKQNHSLNEARKAKYKTRG